MKTVALPERVGPKNGTFAFTPEGEEQIYRAVIDHGMHKLQVAASVGASLPTIDAIIRRVRERLSASQKPEAPGSDKREG